MKCSSRANNPRAMARPVLTLTDFASWNSWSAAAQKVSRLNHKVLSSIKNIFFHQVISRDIFFFGLRQFLLLLLSFKEFVNPSSWIVGPGVSPGAFSWTCENRSTAFICPKIKPRFTLTICHDILLSGWHIAGRWPSEANSIHSGSGDGPD